MGIGIVFNRGGCLERGGYSHEFDATYRVDRFSLYLYLYIHLTPYPKTTRAARYIFNNSYETRRDDGEISDNVIG